MMTSPGAACKHFNKQGVHCVAKSKRCSNNYPAAKWMLFPQLNPSRDDVVFSHSLPCDLLKQLTGKKVVILSGLAEAIQSEDQAE